MGIKNKIAIQISPSKYSKHTKYSTMSPFLLLTLDLLTPLEGMPGLLIGTGSRSAMLA